MSAFIKEIRQTRGPTKIARQQRREATLALAGLFMSAFRKAVAGKSPEFVIEAARWIIRAMSKVVEAQGDIGRAQGILAGAATELSPAWTGERRADHRAAAEAQFSGSQQEAA